MSLFSDLADGDLVFFDGTHRAFMNSDATTFFLDVVPTTSSCPFLPCYYVSTHPELREVLAPLWEDERMRGVDRRGVTFWFTTR